MNRRLVAVVVALLLAVVGGGLVLYYAQGADARAMAGSAPAQVWVTQKTVAAGTTLQDAESSGSIVRTTVASTALPSGALQDIDSAMGKLVALSDIQPGEFVLAGRFGTTPTGEKAIEVPAGKLAISVELSDPARVGTFVTPGSHITIYATYKIKATGDDAASKKLNDLDVKGTDPLLQDVQVIGMGSKPLSAPAQKQGEEGAATDSGGSSFLVTVAVDPDDASRLVHAINNYTLYAALRGTGVKFGTNPGTTDLTIMRGGALP